jgi:hypothetical protein
MRPLKIHIGHKGLRKKLAEGIREKGITDERVLNAY